MKGAVVTAINTLQIGLIALGVAILVNVFFNGSGTILGMSVPEIKGKIKKILAFVLAVGLIAGGVGWLTWPWPWTAKPTPPTFRQTALHFTGTNILRHPAGLAVDNNGTLYVADHDNNRVLKLPAGSDTPTQILEFTDLNWPSGVAVDTAGSVYVADTSNNRVLKLAAGSTAPTPLLTGLNSPRAVAVDASRNVYITDTGNHQVLKVPADSTTPIKLPFTGLTSPVGVAVDIVGSVYVTDVDALRVYKLLNQAPPQIELFSFADLSGPKGVAVDSSLHVYVTDVSNRVLKVAADNSNPTQLDFTNLSNPTGIAVDSSNGNVYVADWGHDLVLKLPPK